MTNWIPPKAHYVQDHAAHDAEAREATDKLYAELQKQYDILKGHGLLVSKSDTWIEVKRGPMEFISITFNFDLKGRSRVINYIEMRLHNKSSFDRDTAEAGIDIFKTQFRDALDSFYKHLPMFNALGLA
jgi:hypothetical protein